jgi:hypothetical protein
MMQLIAIADYVQKEQDITIIDFDLYEKLFASVVEKKKKNFFSFDSRMLDELSLIKGSYRNLEVDYRLCLPLQKHILALVTASDVLHS